MLNRSFKKFTAIKYIFLCTFVSLFLLFLVQKSYTNSGKYIPIFSL